MHAMDIMRMESGFLHWGHDISPEENQYQAGLTFTISNKKDLDFIGKQALEKVKQNMNLIFCNLKGWERVFAEIGFYRRKKQLILN